MKLRLVNDRRFTEPFARYLTKAIKLRIQSDKNLKKMAPFGEMLEKLNIKSTPALVVERGIKEIKYRKIESIIETGYEIYLDENVMFDSEYKVIDLIKLLENGNTEISGYPLFSNAFKEIKEEINDQYRLYELGVGLIYERLPL